MIPKCFCEHLVICLKQYCRRARGCVAPRGDCVNLPPPRETTPHEDARVFAEIKRMLCERIERDEAAKGKKR